MNSLIENLNRWGGQALGLAWPMLWQSSLLIALLFALDFALRRKVRAAIRYALWLVVLAKLVLPPAVCGLFRPVILLPRSLAEQLQPAQLRAVLLHELVHLRRGDVWVNCAQALLQIVYWWHPLLWLANARIRRVREEAVDDAVMLALRDDAETYAPALLEVAKLSFNRPLTSLGLVGILESKNALRQRIERLINFRPPRRAGLTLASVLCVLAFGALALPMGEAPSRSAKDIGGTSANDGTVRPNQAAPVQTTNAFAALQTNRLARPIAPKVEAESLPTPNPYVRTNPVPVSKSRQVIISKLDSIRLDAIGPWDNLPLDEIARSLGEEVKKRDPEGDSINFLINTNMPAGVSNAVDISSIAIKTDSALTDVRLEDVLEAITKAAEKPLKYSIEDNAVVFSISLNVAPPLYSRRFKVNPDTFIQGLERVGALKLGEVQPGNGGGVALPGDVPSGVTRTNVSELVSVAAAKHFSTQGVNINSTAPGRSLFYNDRAGELIVRATMQELDKVEQAIETLTYTPPQVNIRAMFVEITQDDSTAPGFDWYLGNLEVTNAAIGLPGRTPPPANGTPVSPSQPLTNGLGYAAAVSPQLTGVLTEPQFRAVLHAMEQRGRVNMLIEPELTLLSGRQGQLNAAGAEITDYNFTTNSGSWPTTNLTTLAPELDIIPKVLSDGYTINLTLIPTLHEFVGYDKTPPTLPPLPAGAILVPIVFPAFRARHVVTTFNVWDGQTVVLGGFSSGGSLTQTTK